jgi:hypothetical protein
MKSPIIKLMGDQEKTRAYLIGALRPLLIHHFLELLRPHVLAFIVSLKYHKVVRLYGTQLIIQDLLSKTIFQKN